MKPQKNNDVIVHETQGLIERLGICVDRVGGKRALSGMVLVGESTLFRYLSGKSDLPSDKIVAIARAAKVDPSWLLTGEGDMQSGIRPEKRPSFRGELLVQIIQTFEELLTESDKTFTPRQKALATSLIYEALRFEEKRTHNDLTVDKKLAPFYPDFLAPLRSDQQMEKYHNVMLALEYGEEVTFQSLIQFDTHVKLAMLSVFDSSPGELFFEKMGSSLLPEAVKNITNAVGQALQITGKSELDWLDAGCGNGRHLAFLHQHFDNLRLKGFDASKQAIHLCQQFIKAGKLPAGIIEESDFRNLPYENNSFDVVYCRLGLHLTPYVPGQAIGAVKFMQETARVLRSGGIAHMLTYAGSGRDYITFTQYHTEETLHSLAHDSGLNVVSIEPCSVAETGGKAGKDFSSKFDSGFRVVFQKE